MRGVRFKCVIGQYLGSSFWLIHLNGRRCFCWPSSLLHFNNFKFMAQSLIEFRSTQFARRTPKGEQKRRKSHNKIAARHAHVVHPLRFPQGGGGGGVLLTWAVYAQFVTHFNRLHQEAQSKRERRDVVEMSINEPKRTSSALRRSGGLSLSPSPSTQFAVPCTQYPAPCAPCQCQGSSWARVGVVLWNFRACLAGVMEREEFLFASRCFCRLLRCLLLLFLSLGSCGCPF